MPILFAASPLGAWIAVLCIVGFLIYIGAFACHVLANFGTYSRLLEAMLEMFFSGLLEGKPVSVATTLAFAATYFSTGSIGGGFLMAFVALVVVGIATSDGR